MYFISAADKMTSSFFKGVILTLHVKEIRGFAQVRKCLFTIEFITANNKSLVNMCKYKKMKSKKTYKSVKNR